MDKEVTELKVGKGNTIAPFGNIASQVKELVDCLLSDEEIIAIWNEIGFEENSFDYEEELLKAQLEKCKAYIEAKVQAERERHNQRLQYIWLIAQKDALERALPDSRHIDTLLRPPAIDLVEEYANCLLPKEEVV